MDDDVPGHVAGGGDGGHTGLERSVLLDPTIGLDLSDLAGSAHDGESDAAAVLEVDVGGVDDGVDLQTGDVSLQRPDARHGPSIANGLRRPKWLAAASG